MSKDQGWLTPDELERIRRELATDGPPVEPEAGLDAVALTRRALEEARKRKQEL